MKNPKGVKVMYLAQQKKIATNRAKYKIALVYKARKGAKLTAADRDAIAEQQIIIDRWERMTSQGLHL